MAKGWRKYRKEQVERAIRGSHGVKTYICDRLSRSATNDSKTDDTTRPRCSRATLEKYLKEYPELAALLEEEKENMKDLIESKILKLILEDNVTMIIFAAKTLCADRGYSERLDVNTNAAIPVLMTPEEYTALYGKTEQ